MVRRKGTARERWKRKQWYTVVAPKQFNEITVGESPSDESEKLMGRTITTTAGTLTGNNRKNHIQVKLKISKIDGSKAKTEIKKLELSRSYLRSLTRRKTTKVDGQVKEKTKDGKEIVLKSSAFTVGKVQSSTKKDVRLKLEELTREYVKETNSDKIVEESINGKLGEDIKENLKKIAPTKLVEVRKLEL